MIRSASMVFFNGFQAARSMASVVGPKLDQATLPTSGVTLSGAVPGDLLSTIPKTTVAGLTLPEVQDIFSIELPEFKISYTDHEKPAADKR